MRNPLVRNADKGVGEDGFRGRITKQQERLQVPRGRAWLTHRSSS